MKQSTLAGESIEVYGDNKVLDSSKAIISDDAVQHIISILAGLYKDPIVAVIREYTTNAVDAHIEAGRGNIPIQIDLPTAGRPIFRVRDFGRGLDHDSMNGIFKNVGTSTKRYTNALTGGMGIGAKCGFSLVSSMVIRSVVLLNGTKTKRTYSYYKNEDLNVMLDLLKEEVTSDNTGLEIEIPIDASLVMAFEAKAIQTFRFFRVPPKIVNREMPASDWVAGRNLVLNTRTVDGIRVRAKASTVNTSSYGFVMGDIMYPINIHEIRKLFESKPDIMARWNKTFIYLNVYGNPRSPAEIYIDVPIGTLRIAPSREELFYSSQNVMDMLGIVEKAVKIVEDHVADATADCSVGDRAIRSFMFNRYFFEPSPPNKLSILTDSIRDLDKNRMSVWTVSFNAAGSATRTEVYNRDTSGHLYEWMKTLATVSGNNERTIFYYYDFETDKPIASSVINRLIKKKLAEITPTSYRYHYVSLIKLPEDHELIEALDGITIEGCKSRLFNLSSIMENDAALLAEIEAEAGEEGAADSEAMRAALASAAVKRKRSTIKTFRLDGNEWTPADMNTSTEGYYHSIMRFNLDFGESFKRPHEFQHFCGMMERLSNFKLKPMKLYGIKRAEVEKVSKKFGKLKPITAYYRDFANIILDHIEAGNWGEHGEPGTFTAHFGWSFLMGSRTKNEDLKGLRNRLRTKDEQLEKLIPTTSGQEVIIDKRKDWAAAACWWKNFHEEIKNTDTELVQIQSTFRGEIDDSQALRIIAILANLEFLLDEAIKGMEPTALFAKLQFHPDRYNGWRGSDDQLKALLELINNYVPDNWID